jgi:hypothetical protein
MQYIVQSAINLKYSVLSRNADTLRFCEFVSVLRSVLKDQPVQARVENVIDTQLIDCGSDCLAVINGAWYVAITHTQYVERKYH